MKCANKFCKNPSRHHGKLFRLDIEIGSRLGATERKTEYVFLCDACAQKMHPTVEVIGDTVRVRLAGNIPTQVTDSDGPLKRAN